MKIKTIIAAIALMAIPALTFAQTDKSNALLSKELGQQIKIYTAEIKTLKAKLKADPANVEFIQEKAAKELELKKTKDQKKIIDTAIKAEKTSKKETAQAEKALKKHESASKDAEMLKASNTHMTGKSDELVKDELDGKIDIVNNEIKTLKARKKANPNNISIATEISSKQIELKELKRQKKVISTAIKAKKTSKKESAQAEKALKKHENAHKNAEELKSTM